jgi:hypothetical protein
MSNGADEAGVVEAVAAMDVMEAMEAMELAEEYARVRKSSGGTN